MSAAAREAAVLADLHRGYTPAEAAVRNAVPLGVADRLAQTAQVAPRAVEGRGWTVTHHEPSETPQRCAYGLGCTGQPAAGGMCGRHEGQTQIREPRPIVIRPGWGRPKRKGKAA